MDRAPIQLQTRIAYPRKVAPGATYLVSVDLDHAAAAAWPYDDEEYAVTCFLDAGPHIELEAEGDATIVVHRFGGSYGAARFWLTAQEPPEDSARKQYRPSIQVMLVNGSGVPIYTQLLSDIEIVAKGPAAGYVPIQKTEAASAATKQGPRRQVDRPVFRWLHLGDLQFNRSVQQIRPDVASLVRNWITGSGGRIDAVIVSGDITAVALPDEFDMAGDFLSALREAIREAQSFVPALFVVPGNHDAQPIEGGGLVRSKDWSFGPERTAFWTTHALREPVRDAFSYFAGWSVRMEARGANNEEGLLPGDFAYTLDVDGLKVGIVGLNDSILAPPYKGARADVHTDQLSKVCGDVRAWAARHDLRILVTHHEPSSLPPQLQRTFYRSFAPRSLFDLHLYGSTKFKTRLIEVAKAGGGALSASINAARLNGKAPQGFRIGEAQLTGAGVDIRIWPFDVQRQGSAAKVARAHRVSLGLRPAFVEPLEDEKTPKSETRKSIAGRYVLIVRPVNRDVTPSAVDADVMDQAFAAAGFAIRSIGGTAAISSHVLADVRVMCEASRPDDLLVVAFAGHTTVDARSGRTMLLLSDVARPLEEIFDVAARFSMRLLVVGDLANGRNSVPARCGAIGAIGVLQQSHGAADSTEVAISLALKSALQGPTTVREFALDFERRVREDLQRLGESRLPQDQLQPWSNLSVEIADLIIGALPNEQAAVQKLADTVGRIGSVGFDPDFLPGLTVPLPMLMDAAARSRASPLIGHQHFSLKMNPERRMAWYGAVNVDLERRIASDEGLDYEQWRYDQHVPREAQLSDSVFKRSPFDRSRIIKKMQPAWGTEKQASRAFAATGLYTNLMPLVGRVNRNPLWIALPDYIAEHQAQGKRISMLAGPMFAPDDPTFRDVQIPAACWRIIVMITHEGKPAAAAFLTYQVEIDDVPRFRRKLPQAPLVTRVPIKLLETLTQLDFGILGEIDVDIAALGPNFVESSPTPGVPVLNLETAFPSESGPHFRPE